jgi:hypothetical protein
MRDFLVFVRAGANSLHRRLLAEDPRRNWDCCVSWYCAPQGESGAEFYVAEGENKLEAFALFFERTRLSHPYRYYLLLDDDIEFAAGDVSRLFALCARYGCYLAQPALRWGTHANHDVTLWNPLCRIRRTSFVEVMAPCFSREAAEQLLPTFRLARSTWGIDYAWASELRGQGRIAVVDAVRVAHTKPVDIGRGAFYSKLASLGIDALREYGEIKKRVPSFGPLRTQAGGHVPALPWVPGPLVQPFIRLMEGVKKRVHRRLRGRRAE